MKNLGINVELLWEHKILIFHLILFTFVSEADHKLNSVCYSSFKQLRDLELSFLHKKWYGKRIKTQAARKTLRSRKPLIIWSSFDSLPH